MREVREYEREVLGRMITARVTRLDVGYEVLVTGGDRTHVGAVGYLCPEGYLCPDGCASVQFPGHRDEEISSKWARTLAEAFGEPVVVACGIHYDGVNRADIENIVGTCDAILQEIRDGTTDHREGGKDVQSCN